MSTLSLLRRSLTAALLVSASAVALHAETSVLGARGEVHSLVPTTLGALVPATPAEQAAYPVLALETRRGSVAARILVPTTEDAQGESFQNLVFERRTGSIFAVWQGFIGIHPVVYLAEYRAGQWETPILVTRDAFSVKYAPQLVVTRDVAGEGADRIERTILHVLYAQGPDAEADEILYAPVVLHQGRYAGPHQIYRLNDMAPSGSAGPAYPVARALLRQPALRHGVEERSVVASFVDRQSGRLLNIEVNHLPIPLSRLGSEARSQIIIAGVSAMGTHGSVQRQALADGIRNAVKTRALDQGFNAATAASLGDVASQVILSEPQDDANAMQRVAGEARSQIIIAGVRKRSLGLESAPLAEAWVSWTPDGDLASEDARFALLAERVAPRTGAEFETRIHASADGSSVLVSWTDKQKFVRYRESESPEVWSDVREISLSSALGLELAREILDSKVR